MTEQDMIIQDLRREVAQLRAELEWKQKEIELAQRHARQWIKATLQQTSIVLCIVAVRKSPTGCRCRSRRRRLSLD